MALDYKKTEKALYQPSTQPELVMVPEMRFLLVDGHGDPNTSAEYAAALAALFGLSYTIKMSHKDQLDYVVLPLEGFWSQDPGEEDGSVADLDKSRFSWTAAIRQPDFITVEILTEARATLAKKKPTVQTDLVRLEHLTEGLCVQALHLGPFDSESATLQRLEQFCQDQGLQIDLTAERRHHEIYLSDFRKTAPDKLKTILRQPVRAA